MDADQPLNPGDLFKEPSDQHLKMQRLWAAQACPGQGASPESPHAKESTGLLGVLHIPRTVSNSDLKGVRINRSKCRGLLSQGVLKRIPPRARWSQALVARWSQALVARRGTSF